MLRNLHFDFDDPSGLFNSLNSLRTADTAEMFGPSRLDYLQPLIHASQRSNHRIGRLTARELTRMKTLGACTDSKLLVLLLEPTKESDSTITWIDSFLRSASGGKLDSKNTALIICRALIPNGSFEHGYKDDNPAVEKAIKQLSPDVILVCQSSITRKLPNLISRLTRTLGEAGSMRITKLRGKDCTIVNAFHPSTFAKGVEHGRLCDINAVRRAALLEFCFIRAVGRAHGVEIGGPGLEKLQALLFSEVA